MSNLAVINSMLRASGELLVVRTLSEPNENGARFTTGYSVATEEQMKELFSAGE